MQVRRQGVLSQHCGFFTLACFSIYGQKIVWTVSYFLKHYRKFTFKKITLIRVFPNKAKAFHGIHWVLWLTSCFKKTVHLSILRYIETLKRQLHKLQYHLMLFFPLIYRHLKLQSSKLIHAFQLEMLRALQRKHVFILKEWHLKKSILKANSTFWFFLITLVQIA